jgi:hypothetical protein
MVWHSKPVSYILLAVVVLFLTMAQFKSIVNNFDSHLGPQIEAAQGVVDGLPHWRLYQSRVLGPYMVHAVKGIIGWSFQQAYAFMMLVWLAIFFTVLIAVALSLWHSPFIAIAIAASAAFLNTTFMQGLWLYPWDYIDLTIFTLMTWAILQNKPLKIIALIIVVEIFNREAATIIAGWLALDALLEMLLKRKNATTDQVKSAKQQLLVGLTLVIISQGTVETLRSTLLVREVGPEIFSDVKETGPHFELQFWMNLSSLAAVMRSFTNMMLAYNIIFIAIPIICVIGIRSASRELSRISLLFLILWAFTFTFGLIYETRVWLVFVPYLVLAVPRLSLSTGATDPAPLERKTASSARVRGDSGDRRRRQRKKAAHKSRPRQKSLSDQA